MQGFLYLQNSPKAKGQITPGADKWMLMSNKQSSHSLLVRIQSGTTTVETVRQFLLMLIILLSHDPTVMYPGIHTRKMKLCIYKKTRTFLVYSFLIAPNWKQTKCSLIEE